MRKIPYAIKGAILLPILVSILFVFKALCPGGGGCFPDIFAVPIFLPLIAIYRIFGGTPSSSGMELVFIILYWALIGFILGVILDLYTRPSQYSPEQRPPL